MAPVVVVVYVTLVIVEFHPVTFPAVVSTVAGRVGSRWMGAVVDVHVELPVIPMRGSAGGLASVVLYVVM